MGATPYVPVVDPDQAQNDEATAAEIDLAELQDARSDPEINALLKEAAAEGARVERENRQRW